MLEWIASIIVLAFALVSTTQVNASEFSRNGNELKIDFEHSLDGGKTFSRHAIISLLLTPSTMATQSHSATILEEDQLSSMVQTTLLTLAKNNGLYRFRVPLNLRTGVKKTDFISGFSPACELLDSALSVSMHLSVDSSRGVISSVAMFPAFHSEETSSSCEQNNVDLTLLEAKLSDRFNITIRVTDSIEGPVPETQSYLMRIEKERRETEQGHGADNRSFLAKYWMYIVPVFIFLLLSGATTPEQQGGAGGGR